MKKLETNAFNNEAKVAVAVAEVVNAVVEEMANGAVRIVPKHQVVSIVVDAVATTIGVLAKTKMASLLRVRRRNAEAVEAAVATTTVGAATEANEVVNAAATEEAAETEAEIVPEKRVRPSRLSNNKKLSELDRAVKSLSSDEMKITNLEGARSSAFTVEGAPARYRRRILLGKFKFFSLGRFILLNSKLYKR